MFNPRYSSGTSVHHHLATNLRGGGRDRSFFLAERGLPVSSLACSTHLFAYHMSRDETKKMAFALHVVCQPCLHRRTKSQRNFNVFRLFLSAGVFFLQNICDGFISYFCILQARLISYAPFFGFSITPHQLKREVRPPNKVSFERHPHVDLSETLSFVSTEES